MNIHEHQAKEILKKFGMSIPNGIVIFDTKEIPDKINKLKSTNFVVKAQIHAGGRGKAGGIKIAKNRKQLKKIALSKTKVKTEFDVLEPKFNLLREMLFARQKTGLCLTQIAKRMGSKSPSVTRFESSLSTVRH